MKREQISRVAGRHECGQICTYSGVWMVHKEVTCETSAAVTSCDGVIRKKRLEAAFDSDSIVGVLPILLGRSNVGCEAAVQVKPCPLFVSRQKVLAGDGDAAIDRSSEIRGWIRKLIAF
jgi:hypothetical protein